ncbi:YkoP family protein [Paenibacillus motobuensis]|uniref:YkoP-like domain-containing protein n=1 Tax=Paenibacillus motobuensis TaxID=295324 RepID=A0ABN0Y8W9_9BACL
MSYALYNKMLQSLWMAWEAVFERITPLRSVYQSKFGICKIVVRAHRGSSIRFEDGTYVHAGDQVCEIHLDNREVLQLSRAVGADRAAIVTARRLREALKDIGRAVDTDPKLAKAKALTGITLLHRGIIHGLGFELHPLETKWMERISTVYLRLLLRMLNPEGAKRLKQQRSKLIPKMLMMSRASLVNRYASGVKA